MPVQYATIQFIVDFTVMLTKTAQNGNAYCAHVPESKVTEMVNSAVPLCMFIRDVCYSTAVRILDTSTRLVMFFSLSNTLPEVTLNTPPSFSIISY